MAWWCQCVSAQPAEYTTNFLSLQLPSTQGFVYTMDSIVDSRGLQWIASGQASGSMPPAYNIFLWGGFADPHAFSSNPVVTLNGHASSVCGVAFAMAADQKIWLASVGADFKLRLWCGVSDLSTCVSNGPSRALTHGRTHQHLAPPLCSQVKCCCAEH